MIPINGSNSSGVDLNKYVLKNVFNNVVNDLSDNVNKNKLDIEDIKNKVDAANDKFEWLAFDVSKEYTSEYNMKRCFNKYGDSFLIRETAITSIGEGSQNSAAALSIHECHVKTDYGPNIQYTFISDYVYLPAYIRDKDNEKIIYHISECDLLMNKDTVNSITKKIEFGEGWNRILVRYSTFEHIKINSDCSYLGIGNNSVLKDVDLLNCYQLNSCEISNNPNIKNKCFMMRCTPSTFATTGNNNTYLDITQNWFSSDGLWTCKFVGGWHAQDVNLYDRFTNKLRARVNDASNDDGYYKTDINDSVINTDYFKFPSTITFSNDLYNANRTVHIPGVHVAVYTDATFETKNMTSNARVLDFSNGILRIMWDNDNLVEKMIVSPALTELEIKNDTALKSINLVDCDKLTILTIQNCPNITQIVLQHRPTTLTVDSTIKLIVLDEMNNSITTNTNNLTTLNSSVTTNTNNITALDTRLYRLENTIITFPTSKYELIFYTNITKSEPYIDPETQMIPVVKIIDHSTYIEWMAYISPTTKTIGHVDLIKTVNNPNKWNWAVLKDYQTGEEETTVDSVLCVEVPTMFLNCMYYDIKGTGFHTTIISHLIYKNILPGRLTLYETNVKYGLTYSSPGGLYLYNSEVFDLVVDTVNYNVSAADTTNFKEFENSSIYHRYNITTNGIVETSV